MISGGARTLAGAGTSGSSVHKYFASRPRHDRGYARGAVYALIAALSLTSAQPAPAQEKPLEIGALAVGPRKVPAWRCGQGDHPAATEPRRETMPFQVLGLRDGLERLKYVEHRPENAGKAGPRFALDLRIGSLQELRRAARELAEKPVDVIVAVATATVQVAQEETRDHPIPILFPGISDPVKDGLVQSLAQPGGHTSGVSHLQAQGTAKRLELFKEMLPGLRRLLALRHTGYGPSEKSMPALRAAADRLRIDIVDGTTTSREELKAVLANVRSETVDGIMVLSDTFIISNLDLVLETSLARRVPTFGLQDYMADWGALAAYGSSSHQAGKRLAPYVDKIRKGASPGDLPVEPIDPIFVINLKAAECLGVSVPLAVLRQADRVIR